MQPPNYPDEQRRPRRGERAPVRQVGRILFVCEQRDPVAGEDRRLSRQGSVLFVRLASGLKSKATIRSSNERYACTVVPHGSILTATLIVTSV
jgi:hypothetical protein